MEKKILVVSLRHFSVGQEEDCSQKVMSAVGNDERCQTELFKCDAHEKIASLINQIREACYDVILIVWDLGFSEQEVRQIISSVRQKNPNLKMVAVSCRVDNRQSMIEAGCDAGLHSHCRPEIMGRIVCEKFLGLAINKNTINGVATLLASSVNELELQSRAANCLCRGNFEYVWQVCVLSPRTLQQIQGMGAKSVAEVREKCSLFLFCNQDFLPLLQGAFWKWVETIGYKSEATPEQQLQLVQLLSRWPTIRKSVEDILLPKP